jgi:hypothetical protein
MVFVSGKSNPVRADSIQVGDMLRGESGDKKVTKIRRVKRNGGYAPLTPNGSIVVDGIVASNYISLQSNAAEYVYFFGAAILSHQQFAHMLTSPVRLMCMGISAHLCSGYDEDGKPYPISTVLNLLFWVDDQDNSFLQGLVFVLARLVTAPFVAFEILFGAKWIPDALLFLSLVSFILVVSIVREKFHSKKIGRSWLRGF